MKKHTSSMKTAAAAAEKKELTPAQKILWAQGEIMFHLNRCIKQWEEAKVAFYKRAETDLTYAIMVEAEDIMLANFKRHHAEEVLGLLKVHLHSADRGVEFVLAELKEEQARQIAQILDRPYRHNSTCPMNNFEQECELRARTEFWRTNYGFNRSIASEVIRCLEDWLANEAKLLDEYEKEQQA